MAAKPVPALLAALETLAGTPEQRAILTAAAALVAARAPAPAPGEAPPPPDERTLALCRLLGELRSDAMLLAAGLLVKTWRSAAEKDEELLNAVRAVHPEVLAILQALDQLALIDQLHEQEQSDLERLRKMLLALATDMRAVVLKLALQVVLMRHMSTLAPEQQQRYALQTRDIFAPLANRLGIAQLKWELEDRALRVLEPDIYQEISDELEGKRVDRERYIERIIGLLRHELEKFGVPVRKLYGRVKHINSIYQKMKRKGIKFEQLNDIRAVRIETDTAENCYKALAVVDSLWKPIPEEFDDYISKPKANGYQSLHSSFIGPDNLIVEVQIRTSAMHEQAELGMAAHWLYKEKGVKHSLQFEKQIEWLRRMISGGDPSRGDVVFDAFKNEAFRERVYAVSPQGMVIDLPEGATPLDFAYHIHTSLGHRCRGAKVNGQMVPLTTALKNGDSVEILTQKELNPSRDWLNKHLGYLQSERARAKVRSYFKKLDKDSHIAAGRELLDKECRRLGLRSDRLAALADKFNQHSAEDVLALIGSGEVGVLTVAHALEEQQRVEQPLSFAERLALLPIKRRRGGRRQSVEIEGLGDGVMNFASCCQPLPPVAIGGFLTQGRGVNIHRRDCRNFEHLARVHPERLVAVRWSAAELGAFPVKIRLEAQDNANMLRDINAVLVNEGVPILEVNLQQQSHYGRLAGQMTLEVVDMEQLSRTLHHLGQIDGMIGVERQVD